jgi:hypothetical protein
MVICDMKTHLGNHGEHHCKRVMLSISGTDVCMHIQNLTIITTPPI